MKNIVKKYFFVFAIPYFSAHAMQTPAQPAEPAEYRVVNNILTINGASYDVTSLNTQKPGTLIIFYHVTDRSGIRTLYPYANSRTLENDIKLLPNATFKFFYAFLRSGLLNEAVFHCTSAPEDAPLIYNIVENKKDMKTLLDEAAQLIETYLPQQQISIPDLKKIQIFVEIANQKELCNQYADILKRIRARLEQLVPQRQLAQAAIIPQQTQEAKPSQQSVPPAVIASVRNYTQDQLIKMLQETRLQVRQKAINSFTEYSQAIDQARQKWLQQTQAQFAQTTPNVMQATQAPVRVTPQPVSQMPAPTATVMPQPYVATTTTTITQQPVAQEPEQTHKRQHDSSPLTAASAEDDAIAPATKKHAVSSAPDCPEDSVMNDLSDDDPDHLENLMPGANTLDLDEMSDNTDDELVIDEDGTDDDDIE